MLKIWGILNLSSNSFYTSPKNHDINLIESLLNNDLDVIDIGAETTKPYSSPISWQEEWSILEPYLISLKKSIGIDLFTTKISIDTYKAEVIHRCLDMGIGIINDVTGLSDEMVIDFIAKYKSKVVLMHSQGLPSTMQNNPNYNNVVEDILSFLNTRSQEIIKKGILPNNIIWDYGIGFGKSMEHNLQLLKNTHLFKEHSFPLLVGLSRKSFIGKLLNLDNPKDRGAASLVLHTYLMCIHKVDIIRTHDIIEAIQMRRLLRELL